MLFMATILERVESQKGFRFSQGEVEDSFDVYAVLTVAAELDMEGHLDLDTWGAF